MPADLSSSSSIDYSLAAVNTALSYPLVSGMHY